MPMRRKTRNGLQLQYNKVAQMPLLSGKKTTTILRQGCFRSFWLRVDPLQCLFLSDERSAACYATTTAVLGSLDLRAEHHRPAAHRQLYQSRFSWRVSDLGYRRGPKWLSLFR